MGSEDVYKRQLEGLVKHNGPIKENIPMTINELNNKFNLQLNEFPSLEAQISSIADDIAYNNHDLDDGLRAGFFSYDELANLPLIGDIIKSFPPEFELFEMQRINNEITRKSTAIMIKDVMNTIDEHVSKLSIKTANDVRLQNQLVADFSPVMKEKVSSIKSFLSSKMYNHDKVKSMTQNAHKIITSLFELFMNTDDMIYSKYLSLIHI